MLGNTVAQTTPNQANEFLKNATVAVPLKYLSNFWRSIEMPLINYKTELKLKYTKSCVLAANGNDDDSDNDNDNNTIFNIKDTKIICSCNNFISKIQSKTIKTS